MTTYNQLHYNVDQWYDSLNDTHTHELHHAFYDYIQAINEEDYD